MDVLCIAKHNDMFANSQVKTILTNISVIVV